MKLGPVTNFNKINKTASEKFDDFVKSFVFSQFMANLEQCGSWIQDK